MVIYGKSIVHCPAFSIGRVFAGRRRRGTNALYDAQANKSIVGKNGRAPDFRSRRKTARPKLIGSSKCGQIEFYLRLRIICLSLSLSLAELGVIALFVRMEI